MLPVFAAERWINVWGVGLQELGFPEANEIKVTFDCDGRSPVTIGTKSEHHRQASISDAVTHTAAAKQESAVTNALCSRGCSQLL